MIGLTQLGVSKCERNSQGTHWKVEFGFSMKTVNVPELDPVVAYDMQPFLQSIISDPDNDEPRRWFAVFLRDDMNDSDWADFIDNQLWTARFIKEGKPYIIRPDNLEVNTRFEPSVWDRRTGPRVGVPQRMTARIFKRAKDFDRNLYNNPIAFHQYTDDWYLWKSTVGSIERIEFDDGFVRIDAGFIEGGEPVTDQMLHESMLYDMKRAEEKRFITERGLTLIPGKALPEMMIRFQDDEKNTLWTNAKDRGFATHVWEHQTRDLVTVTLVFHRGFVSHVNLVGRDSDLFSVTIEEQIRKAFPLLKSVWWERDPIRQRLTYQSPLPGLG